MPTRYKSSNVIQFTPGVFVLGVLGIIVAVGLLFFTFQNFSTQKQVILQPSEQPLQNIQVISEPSQGDDRYTRAPKPERDWLVKPDISTIFNSPTAIVSTLPALATRGIPETYQSMGVLKTDTGQILPLYGRRTASRSDRFQYYTRTDSYNPIQLPLEHKRHNCQDDVGCDEVYDGDSLKIAATGEKATATIYRFSGPTYIPAVI
jgi:hypothetical protein